MSTNSLWYLGLSFISLNLILYVIYKKKWRGLFLLLIMIQIAYLIETVIYIFLGSYEYRPQIIKHSAYYDSNLGALASNLLAVPALATLYSAFHLSKKWYFLFILFLAAVEWLFVKLHIYFQYWWRTEYTIIGLFGYLFVAKVLYPRLTFPVQGWSRTLFLFLCTAPVVGTFHIIPIMFFLNRDYVPGWFEDQAHDTTAFASIYYLAGTFLILGVLKLRRINRRMKYTLLAVIFLFILITLQKTDLLVIHASWDPWYYLLFPLIAFRIAEVFNQRMSNPPPNV